MIDPLKIIQARKYGEVRYAVISDVSGKMNQVLKKFGLEPDADALIEHDRNSASLILRALLWKDMAYDDECMPVTQAEYFAEQVLLQFSEPASRYFSNGNWANKESWNPLTESTFDGGIIISNPTGQYFCIWFQDED